MARSTIEREWQAHGLDCAVLLMDMGHRCGYVRVTESHPWFGLDYDAEAPSGSAADLGSRTVDDAGMGGLIATLSGESAVDDWSKRIEGHIAIHGGLTYSGKAPGDLPSGWWFGFDCAHLDDTPEQWTEDAVAAEVERLAEQLAQTVAA